MTPRVLIVDDETAVTLALRRALRNEPYDIQTANSGQEALRILRRSSIDVVVSDEQMPGLSGTEFLAIVCREYPDTVRIMLTGQRQLDVVLRSINEGQITRYLTKPCDREELKIVIRQALEQRRLRLLGRKALRALERQESVLRSLESHCPGITSVERDVDGTIVLEDMHENLDALTRELTEALGEFQVREGTE